MTIVNLRGTNGSGKSTAVRNILINNTHSQIKLTKTGDRGRYVPDLDLIIVGEYPFNTGGLITREPYALVGGGCDVYATQDLVCEAVREAHRTAMNVIFEGVIVSTIYKRYAALARTLGNFVFAYMDTPVEVALERVYQRNNGLDIQEQTFYDKVKTITVTRQSALADGFRVAMIPWEDPVPALLELLE